MAPRPCCLLNPGKSVYLLFLCDTQVSGHDKLGAVQKVELGALPGTEPFSHRKLLTRNIEATKAAPDCKAQRVIV